MARYRDRVYCQSCKRKTNHAVLQKHVTNEHEEELNYWKEDKYYIVQCQGCDSIAFVHSTSDSNMVILNDHVDLEPFTHTEVYPQEPDRYGRQSIEPETFANVPESIAKLYRQLIAAYNYGLALLCAAGLRVLIEAVCLQVSVTDGPLYDPSGAPVTNKVGAQSRSSSLEGKIYGLGEKDHLTNKQCRVLQQIRLLGNEALHEIITPHYSVLQDGIEVAEIMLKQIYDLDKYKIAKPKAP